jgi:LuxR family maltose regulon positive regulatory protein
LPGRPRSGGRFPRPPHRARQAIELARRHGWTDEPAFGIACRTLGSTLAWQVRPEAAEPWILHGERTVTAEAEPAAAVAVCFSRGTLEWARGRDRDALAAFRAAERAAGLLDAPHLVIARARALQVFALVALVTPSAPSRPLTVWENTHGNVATCASLLDGSATPVWVFWLTQAFLLEASARDALGDRAAADQALERALDLAQPDGWLLPFLLHPAPRLLERHARHRTAHAALIAEILGLLAGSRPAPPPAGPRLPVEPLSESELRVLRYLPTNLTGPEIAGQLYVSVNTVKTHVRNLYAKLGTHRRAEAVIRARDLGLLAPSGRSAH